MVRPKMFVATAHGLTASYIAATVVAGGGHVKRLNRRLNARARIMRRELLGLAPDDSPQHRLVA